MTRPLIFISHISEEAELATALKESIQDSFLGMIEIFVSSDKQSIPLGSNWLQQISTALERASIILICCGPQSISRPWINFEAGAGWVRKVSVVPICHSGLEPSKLSLPFSLLQGIEIRDAKEISELFGLIASSIGCTKPKVMHDDLVAKIKHFEKRNRVGAIAAPHMEAIRERYPELGNLMDSSFGDDVVIESAEDWKVNSVRPNLMALEKSKLLEYYYNKNQIRIVTGGAGSFEGGSLTVKLTPELTEYLFPYW